MSYIVCVCEANVSGEVQHKKLLLMMEDTCRRGQIAGRLNDDTLKNLLDQLAQQTRHTTTVKVGFANFSTCAEM